MVIRRSLGVALRSKREYEALREVVLVSHREETGQELNVVRVELRGLGARLPISIIVCLGRQIRGRVEHSRVARRLVLKRVKRL